MDDEEITEGEIAAEPLTLEQRLTRVEGYLLGDEFQKATLAIQVNQLETQAILGIVSDALALALILILIRKVGHINASVS